MGENENKGFLKIENLGDGVLSIVINSPKTLNALNAQIIKELEEVFTKCGNSSDVRVIVLSGKGKAFVAGADITSLSDFTAEQAAAFSAKGQELFNLMERISQPIVAVINGFALGGGLELALACDFRFASEDAQLGLPELHLGIIPGFGGTQRLVSVIGFSRAKEIILTGERINAAVALEWGLVNKVFPKDRLWDESLAFARSLAKQSYNALSQAKRVLNSTRNTPIQDGLKIENSAFYACFNHPDSREGIKAFIEKRKPKFN